MRQLDSAESISDLKEINSYIKSSSFTADSLSQASTSMDNSESLNLKRSGSSNDLRDSSSKLPKFNDNSRDNNDNNDNSNNESSKS